MTAKEYLNRISVLEDEIKRKNRKKTQKCSYFIHDHLPDSTLRARKNLERSSCY